MGGINCYTPRPTVPPDVVKGGAATKYAEILRNVFNCSAYFSFANANIENVMLDEMSQKNKAISECRKALEYFTMAMNFAQTSVLLLDKFIQSEGKKLGTERTDGLRKTKETLGKVVINHQELLRAYNESDVEHHINLGDLDKVIRENEVTTCTEALADNISETMLDLKENSVRDRECEAIESSTYVMAV